MDSHNDSVAGVERQSPTSDEIAAAQADMAARLAALSGVDEALTAEIRAAAASLAAEHGDDFVSLDPNEQLKYSVSAAGELAFATSDRDRQVKLLLFQEQQKSKIEWD